MREAERNDAIITLMKDLQAQMPNGLLISKAKRTQYFFRKRDIIMANDVRRPMRITDNLIKQIQTREAVTHLMINQDMPLDFNIHSYKNSTLLATHYDFSKEASGISTKSKVLIKQERRTGNKRATLSSTSADSDSDTANNKDNALSRSNSLAMPVDAAAAPEDPVSKKKPALTKNTSC